MARLMYDIHNCMAVCHRCHVDIHYSIGKDGRRGRHRRNEVQIKDAISRLFGACDSEKDPGGCF